MEKNLKKLVLLHSNDMHGDFLAEDVDEKLVGGVSRLSGYVNKVRAEEPNTLYCVAGDMFRGSVMDSEFKGVSTIQIMNALGPDVVTLGNHETDYGLAHLLFIEKCAAFPIVNANMFIKMNGARLFKPCEVIEIGGMKVLFIGILTEQVIAQTKKDGIIGSMVDISDAAAEVGKICNSYQGIDIDFTVLLTHIGWDEDHKLAEMLDPAWGVDVIIGGHSHTFIEQPDCVNGVYIVQAGTGTDQIGRFDIMVNTDENCVDSWTWRAVPIDDTHCPEDPVVVDIIKGIKDQTDAKYGRVVTRLFRELVHPNRYIETELGNLMADIMRDSLSVDVAFFGSGSIRTLKLGPVVRFQDLTECIPYAGKVWEVKWTGAQLKTAIRRMNRDEALINRSHTEYYQVSRGLHYVYSMSKHDFEEITLDGRPIMDDQLYSIAIQDYHFINMDDGFGLNLADVEPNMKPRIVCTSDTETVEEYLASHHLLDRRVDDRQVIVD